jgi:hypothetical protein
MQVTNHTIHWVEYLQMCANIFKVGIRTMSEHKYKPSFGHHSSTPSLQTQANTNLLSVSKNFTCKQG